MANGERREIPGYPNYLVSEEGGVWRLRRLGQAKYDTAVPVAQDSEGKVGLSGPAPWYKGYHVVSVQRLVEWAFPNVPVETAHIVVSPEVIDEVLTEYFPDAPKPEMEVLGGLVLPEPTPVSTTTKRKKDKA